MISVVINWLYIMFITFFTGYFALKRVYCFMKYDGKIRVSSSIAAGLALTTVYAGYFSIFYRVGILANVIIIIVCVAFICIDRSDYVFLFKSLLSGIKKAISANYLNVIKLAGFVILFIAVLYYTTEGQFFSDSGYYHEQSIRWIEEYGTVKGSIHVLQRLAYNSHYFCQCALFSMRDVFGGQSLHCLGGFYAIFVAGYALCGLDKNVRTNVLRLAPIIYFMLFCSEIISPASDFPLSFIVMYVAIRWFEMNDDKEEHYAPYALLMVFVVYIISIKLTVGCLVLLTVKPAIEMVKGRKIKEIVMCLLAGIVFILPYFIRNYLICGWLIYPFAGIDLFNPKWKALAELVQGDADEIKIWGRGMGRIGGQVSDSIKVWLPHWWNYVSGPNQRIIICFCLITAIYIVFRAISLFSVIIKKEQLFNIEKFYKYLFESTIIFSLLYWFIESPLFRYGLVYILIAMSYMIGDMMLSIYESSLMKKLSMAGIVKVGAVIITVAILSPLWITLREYLQWDYEVARYYNDNNCILMQKDYPKVEYGETDIEGITFYYPKDELGQIGYHIFPALWHSGTEGIHLLGNDIRDGFYFEK